MKVLCYLYLCRLKFRPWCRRLFTLTFSISFLLLVIVCNWLRSSCQTKQYNELKCSVMWVLINLENQCHLNNSYCTLIPQTLCTSFVWSTSCFLPTTRCTEELEVCSLHPASTSSVWQLCFSSLPAIPHLSHCKIRKISRTSQKQRAGYTSCDCFSIKQRTADCISRSVMQCRRQWAVNRAEMRVGWIGEKQNHLKWMSWAYATLWHSLQFEPKTGAY